MIDQLNQFDRIAWDFDGTLYDHQNSPLMHQFIIDNPQKTHVIITFRTHGTEHSIFREMLRAYPDAPDESHFDDVFNISDRAWEGQETNRVDRMTGKLEGPPTPWELYYRHWKGLVCKLRNLQVMIDDRPYDVVPGCEKYGIAFVHPDSL